MGSWSYTTKYLACMILWHINLLLRNVKMRRKAFRSDIKIFYVNPEFIFKRFMTLVNDN